MKWERVNTAKFIEARYASYLQKKKFFDDAGLLESVILTDLDKTDFETGKPLKFTVLCDSCNEHIHDAEFMMLEESRVYHMKCVDESVQRLFPDNVLPIKGVKK